MLTSGTARITFAFFVIGAAMLLSLLPSNSLARFTAGFSQVASAYQGAGK